MAITSLIFIQYSFRGTSDDVSYFPARSLAIYMIIWQHPGCAQ